MAKPAIVVLQVPLPRSELPKTYSATRISLREKQRERGRGKEQQQEGEGEGEGEVVVGKKSGVPPIISQSGAGSGAEIEGASTKYFVSTEVCVCLFVCFCV